MTLSAYRGNPAAATVVTLRRERDEARALNVKLRNKLLQWAGECTECDGTGVATIFVPHVGQRQVCCPDCADIREALE